jgi:DNA-3-methyladenine glycosylase II
VHRRAITALRAADPALAAVIDRAGPCRLRPQVELSYPQYVARAIVGQQLSGKAAATIYARLCDALGHGTHPTPEAYARARLPTLRAAGLSDRKAEYVRELAQRTLAGDLPWDRIDVLPDDAVIDTLTAIRGIGRWTAQMFLMFRLGRPDVLPELDLGIQKGIQLVYRKRKLPTPAQVTALGTRWAPHRSVAAWYLWRALDI